VKPVVYGIFKASTLKGLNVKRSNERSEIIATGETCGMPVEGPNPERVEYE
jgi:hypothetical protein